MSTLPGVDIVSVRDGNATASTYQKKNAAARLPGERANHFIMMMDKYLANVGCHKLRVSFAAYRSGPFSSRIWISLSAPNPKVEL